MHTILWIHGFPLSARIFARQRAIIAAHVMPDLPGFGRALPPEGETSMESYARFALDQSPVRKVIVAGLSMGGYAAFAAARIAPERVKGLILIDTRATADTEEQRKARYESIEKVKAEGVAPVVSSMLPKMLTKNAKPELVDEVQRIMSASSPQGVIAALDAMAKRPDSTDLLPTLNIPALVIVGEEDTITPPSDAEKMAAALPNAKLVKIANAAHLSNVEQSHEFNAVVDAWLSAIGSR
jgi:3-oxoadipate enol-lactonase